MSPDPFEFFPADCFIPIVSLKDEIKEFGERLAQVKAQLTSELEKVTQDKRLLKEQIESLSRDIEFLKKSPRQ